MNKETFYHMVAIPFFALSSYWNELYWTTALILFLVYIFIYRPILSITRLRYLSCIDEGDTWRLFIPLYELNYKRQLYLG